MLGSRLPRGSALRVESLDVFSVIIYSLGQRTPLCLFKVPETTLNSRYSRYFVLKAIMFKYLSA